MNTKNWTLRLKIFFKKIATKLGLSSEFDFLNYRQKRNIFIVIALAAVALIGATSFVVGGIYQNKALLDKISQLNSIIEKDDNQITSLKNLTQNYSEQIVQKGKLIDFYIGQTNDLNNSIISLNSTIIELQNETSSLQNLTASLQDQIVGYQANTSIYKQVIKSSVRSVCCTLSDVFNGVKKNWSLYSGAIICSGESQVDCASGATYDVN